MIFHGWIQIEADDSDDADASILDQRQQACAEKLKDKLKETTDDFCHFDVKTAGNGLTYLTVHGNRNHRFQPVIDLFEWIAESLEHSFGLLYVWDDEEKGRDNEFVVYRVARGSFTQHDDSLLSPCIPTIEEPYEFKN